MIYKHSPHVIFTSPQEWGPTVVDHVINLELLEDTGFSSDESLLQDPIFDEFGELNE